MVSQFSGPSLSAIHNMFDAIVKKLSPAKTPDLNDFFFFRYSPFSALTVSHIGFLCNLIDGNYFIVAF